MAERFRGLDETGQEEVVAEAAAPPIEAMSFEQALAELEAIVQKLERGQLDLEASILAYERGTALRLHCAERLRHAQMRVERLTLDADGRPRTTPFDSEPA